jgi:hypothetical protein
MSMEMPMETFHRHLWQGMWENKNVYGNVWKLSIEIFKKLSIDICGKECGKIKMSMEMS